MSKLTRTASAPRAAARSRGRRIGVVAITGAAVAIAGTAAWMTFGAPSATPIAPSPAPAAQAAQTPQPTPAPTAVAQPQTSPATTSTATLTPAAQALAARTHALPIQSTQAIARQTPSALASTPAASPMAPGVAGQQAFVDPKTGQLRPAEHDDVAAIAAARTSSQRRLARTAQTASEPQEFATEGGAMGVAVPDELQPYTVATKTSDGKVVLQHVTGGKAAVAKVRENTKKGGMTVDRKGEPNDR